MRTMSMMPKGRDTETEARRSERLLKLSLILALGLMAALLVLCMSNQLS
jgi:hypothetical protein